jgi:hypothetical protein
MSWVWCLTLCLLGLLAAGYFWLLAFDSDGIVLVGLSVVLTIGAFVPWAFYSPHPGAPCLHTHPETTYILVGKVLVPSTDDVCDLWGPKK